jgi:hypothetical protein
MKSRNKYIETTKAGLGSMESRLSRSFVPVKPDRRFIDHLGNRIHTGRASAIVDRLADLRFSLVLLTGILSVVALVLLGAWRFLSGSRK